MSSPSPGAARRPFLDRVRFVLVRPIGALNIGLTARAMKNMGLGQLSLVAPPHYREKIARVMSSRADDVLDRMTILPDLPAALGQAVAVAGATSRSGGARGPFLSPAELARHFLAQPGDGELVVVFGPEDHGLSARDLDHCPLRVAIPSDPDYPSLNLSQAVQVLAYELRLAALAGGAEADAAAAAVRQQPATESVAPGETRELATRGQLEGLYGHLGRLLERVGFLNPQNPDHIQASIRRVIDRAAPDPREVAIARGLIASIERLLRE